MLCQVFYDLVLRGLSVAFLIFSSIKHPITSLKPRSVATANTERTRFRTVTSKTRDNFSLL